MTSRYVSSDARSFLDTFYERHFVHYYSHHVGDFIRDTSRMTDAQCMAYLRLIWMYYETEQPLENDIDALAFKIGSSSSDVNQILKHFFTLNDDGLWHQSRCDKEIAGFYSKSERARNSANARWNNANALQPQTERNADEPLSDATHNPIPITHNPIKNINDTSYHLSSPDDDALAVEGKKDKLPCPHERIFQAFNETLGHCLPTIKMASPARRTALKLRWGELSRHENLSYSTVDEGLKQWTGLFSYIASIDFLCGRTKEQFRPGFDWIVKPANFIKIIEGNYDNNR